jgi:DNA polymerase I
MSKTEKNKKLVLLDAHAILHRAYHALPEFATKAGEPTGALYGIAAMLMKIIQDLKPDFVIACYDLPGPTYRHEAYVDYKAGRKKAEEDLISQIIRSRDIFEAFGIPIYDKAGYEADDIIGTIAEITKKKKDFDVVIASGDMDTLQLVEGKKVTVYTLKKGIKDTIVYDEQAVIDRFGFKPEMLADYKGLRGDLSDNIIGIAGIGEKTASELILKFGSIENIYKQLRKDKSVFEKEGIKPRIIKLLEEGEEEALFSKMLATIKKDVPINFEIPKKEFTEAIDVEKIDNLMKDLEFRTLRVRAGQMFGAKTGDLLQENQKEISAEEIKKIGLALWVIDSNYINPDISDILDYAKTDDFEEAKKKIMSDLDKNPSAKIYYEIEEPLTKVVVDMQNNGIKLDREYLKKLSENYHKKINKLEQEIYKLAGQEFNINSPRQMGEVLFEKMELKIKGHKKTGSGAKSTRESELEKLKDAHPIIGKILTYRGLQKLLSTYIDNLPLMVLEDGRLHTTFLQTGTVTGRMSSNNPNLQNIPVGEDEENEGVRRAFVAEEGMEFVALDYSQIELRIAAILSNDPKLVEIFRSGEDVHAAVAAEVFGVKRDAVSSDMRRQAKVINFGILYGMGVNALKENLGSDRETAQKFYNDYFKEFSGLATYLENVKADVYKKGYTETLFGRRRYFPDIKSRLPFIRAAAERMAINAPIQGSQSDIIKKAMISIHDFLQKNKLQDSFKMVLQVHDELIFEATKKDSLEIAKQIKEIMENVLPLEKTAGIKLGVNISKGDNWADLKKITN